MELFLFCPVYCLIVFGMSSQQTHNVATTSLQRRCNVVTLQRRCNDVVCLLDYHLLRGRRSCLLCFSLVCILCAVRLSLFSFPLSIFGRICDWGSFLIYSFTIFYISDMTPLTDHFTFCLRFVCDHWAHPDYIENRIPLKPALGGVCSLANYSVAYEETQSNRASDFRDCVCSLFQRQSLLMFILCRLWPLFEPRVNIWCQKNRLTLPLVVCTIDHSKAIDLVLFVLCSLSLQIKFSVWILELWSPAVRKSTFDLDFVFVCHVFLFWC